MPKVINPGRAREAINAVPPTVPDLGNAAQTPEAPLVARPRRNLAKEAAAKFSLLGVWAVMAAFFAIVEPHKFIRSGTAHAIFSSQATFVFLGMALVIAFVTGGFDLSVASVLGLSATLVPVLVVLHGMNIWFAIVVALLAAVVIGAINGVLVVTLGVNPIVATLGMGTLLIGVSSQLTSLNTVSGLSPTFARAVNRNVVGLPVSFYLSLVLCLSVAYVLRFTALGRQMLFVGANREVARLAGIRVDVIRFGAYIAASAISGVGGVILVLGLSGFDPGVSASYLLPSLSALFLGTAAFQPGRFNPLGSLVAIYFLVTGIIGLQLMGLAGWISDVFYGSSLVIAVTIATVIRTKEHGNR